MPYISKSAREALEPEVSALVEKIDHATTPGELNYIITKVIAEYWRLNPTYSTIAEITGVLENVKQEFYRRLAAPYENEKLAVNGDVYE